MNETISVSAIQFEPIQFEKGRNLDELAYWVEQAAKTGSKLIVTPEMGTTGYCWESREEVAPFVEPIPGATTDRFAALARRYNCYIVIGMPEVDPVDDLYYNAAVLLGPEGIVGKHRKTHPYISEPKWAASGNLGHPVFDTPIGKIALLICMDIHFVETARIAGLSQALIICHLSNWLAECTPAPYWINRAFENGCYLIESNRWGCERGVQFSGGSCIIEPDGTVQTSIDSGDCVLHGVVDPAKVLTRQSMLLEARRPELYKELAAHTFCWNPLPFFDLYGLSPLPKGKHSKIAVGQFMPGSDPLKNMSFIIAQAATAKAQHAELIVFPELSLSGPFLSPESALPPQGGDVSALIRLAAQLRMHIVAGMVEEDSGRFYNSAVLVGPEGLVGRYRKIHLSEHDKTWATPGNHWQTFDLTFGRMGVLIGDDVLLPESARILSLRGCDLIACPAALNTPRPWAHAGTSIPLVAPIPTGADQYHWHLARVRAGENNVYMAFANSFDLEHDTYGASGVFGPDTFAFPRAEAMITQAAGCVAMTIDTSNLDTPYPTNVVRRKDLVSMRQPHHYSALWQTSAR